MESNWLGCCFKEAQFVFLLPNRPILPTSYVKSGLDVHSLIELNGNHWRKILTIMAKLTAPNYEDWRDHRDNRLFNNVAMIFSDECLEGFVGQAFIVGNRFRDTLPIPDSASVIGVKHCSYIESNYVWCPYLDYRQFPNDLIEQLRANL